MKKEPDFSYEALEPQMQDFCWEAEKRIHYFIRTDIYRAFSLTIVDAFRNECVGVEALMDKIELNAGHLAALANDHEWFATFLYKKMSDDEVFHADED